eukprot:8674886-Ditylum_brightwellii.AAC.1
MATIATAITSQRAVPVASAFQTWMRLNSKLMNKAGNRHYHLLSLPSSSRTISPVFTVSDGITPFSHWRPKRSSASKHPFGTLMMTVDDDEVGSESDADAKTVESTWNIPGLKKEAARLTLRCHKKIGKASTRLEGAKVKVEELKTDPDATLEQLEQCPDVGAMEAELDYLRTRLTKLNELEGMLTSVSKKNSVLPEEMALLAIELDVNDEPPKRQPQNKKTKKKGPKTQEPRKPYRKYFSKNNTEIR